MKRSFKCDYCGWAFTDKSNKYRHMRTRCGKKISDTVKKEGVTENKKNVDTQLISEKHTLMYTNTNDNNQNKNQKESHRSDNTNNDQNNIDPSTKLKEYHNNNNMNNEKSVTTIGKYDNVIDDKGKKHTNTNIVSDDIKQPENVSSKTEMMLMKMMEKIEQMSNKIKELESKSPINDNTSQQMKQIELISEEIKELKNNQLTNAEIKELKNKPAINVNALIQNNLTVVCFNDKMLNIYQKKKDKYGEKIAYEYLFSKIKNANSSNKLDFLKDPDIIDPSKEIHPVKLLTKSKKNANIEISVQVTPDEKITTDEIQFDKMTNNIVKNSVCCAVNDIINKLSNDEYRLDQWCNSPVHDKSGKNIYHHSDKYENIQATQKHLISTLKQKKLQ